MYGILCIQSQISYITRKNLAIIKRGVCTEYNLVKYATWDVHKGASVGKVVMQMCLESNAVTGMFWWKHWNKPLLTLK